MRWILVALLALAHALAVRAQSSNAGAGDYLRWVVAEAARLREAGSPLVNSSGNHADARKAFVPKLESALGIKRPGGIPLDPVVTGRIEKPDYVIEKVHFQTLPGVRMPANLYLPKKAGRLPAVLHVHGHWSGAKQDPVVQARCVSSARAGFVALSVDAFGAGERAVGQALGEYHGGMTAATLLPIGKPLAGIQVLENARAVDYLLSRPEVDGQRLGVTGASGGGNQTMYAGALDDRLKAVVPVCSVGNYQAYLGAACCMCEVVPGALQFTEEDAVLAAVAPRALKVISASRDARQFSPAEAARSISGARSLFGVLGREGVVEHHVFESGHDYSKPMREAMVGFMRRHLLNQGAGEPVPDADFTPEPRENLRCFAAGERPASWLTLPQYAAAEGRRSLGEREWPKDTEGWNARRKEAGPALAKLLHGDFPIRAGRGILVEESAGATKKIVIETEPGISLPVTVERGDLRQPMVVLLHEEGAAVALKSPVADALRKKGAGLVGLDLRATGSLAVAGERIGLAPDHNSAEWAMWLGRPLAGQWTYDLKQVVNAVMRVLPDRRPIMMVGVGPMGITALLAAAQDDQIAAVASVDSMVSWISEKPYAKQRLATIIPHVIPKLGDIPQVAAMVGNQRRLIIAGGTDGQGQPLPAESVTKAFAGIQGALGKGPEFIQATPEAVADAMTRR